MDLSKTQLFTISVASIIIILFNYKTNSSETYENIETNEPIVFSSDERLDDNVMIDTGKPINYIESTDKQPPKTYSKYAEIGKKNYSEITNNYNLQYHVPEDILKMKNPELLKENNITFEKNGTKKELIRLPAQNRATFYEPGEKYFISNYVPTYKETILLSKKKKDLNYNEIN